MSRPRPSPDGSKEELEELDEGAILSHQAAPHAPQRRAQVAVSDERSVVIAEGASRPGSRPYRADRGEATVVIRDRRDLQRARRQILAELSGKQPLPRAVLIGAGVAVFAIVGALVIVWLRAPSAELTKVVAPSELVTEIKPPPPAQSVAAPKAELPTPKISLEELPLERPRRRQ
ncbi:MAG: hypothetical protein QM756_31990 [Polyangiaceae bacterium]